jgi:predicted dehydrogenase
MSKRWIGLIGCGGISSTHLAAYRDMGLNVVALCDRIASRARARRKEFFPDAAVYTDYNDLLRCDDIEVIDIATHPQDRAYLIPAAIDARKHVLSQKPFVMDLSHGRRFVELAEKRGVQLAVNQNGRWAPHFSYLRAAVAAGLVGDVCAVHAAVHWDHEWIKSRPFNRVHHIVLYDFAIHWFDMVHCLMQERSAKRVFATLARASHQTARPPLLGQALIEYDDAQASLVFDAATRQGILDSTYVTGSAGTLQSVGPHLQDQTVTVSTRRGEASPKIRGTWFREGFMGTMGELLCAIEKKRAPLNNAADNLNSLALCFAAVVSAETGKPQDPRRVTRVPVKTCSVAEE